LSQGLATHELPLEDVASDILRLVVDMPEDEDLIWQAYQDEEPSDEEEEARMMEANEV
jgi:hypothetical protein